MASQTKHFIIFLFLLSFFVNSCTRDSSSSLKRTLKEAGKNRTELKKALEHYSNHPEDSLKYEALCFLINNMYLHYTYTSEKYEKIKREIYQVCIDNEYAPVQAVELLENKYGKIIPDEYTMSYDLHTIKAEYLIDNIEWAFKVWQEAPWGKYISFDQFCEEILPYRVGNESLEYWREAYYNKYQPTLDSLSVQSSLEACQIIYEKLMEEEWLFESIFWPYPSPGPGVLLNDRFGNCIHRCEMVVYALRSVGIPCGIDMMIQSPEKKNPVHFWNFMMDERGKRIDFAIEDMAPDSMRQTPHYKRGKVYQQCYGQQLENRVFCNYVISKNYGVKLKDVSSYYFPQESIEIPIHSSSNMILLNVFNNKDWIPIDGTEKREGKAIFKHPEPGIVYMLSTVNKYGRKENYHFPFIYKGCGEYQFLSPDTIHKQELVLKRKYPFSDRLEMFQRRLLGGKFQVANQEDFSDAITLHSIDTIPELEFQYIPVSTDKEFRYFRYLAGKDSSHCDMGEIKFIQQQDNLPLKGKIIAEATPFDNDPQFRIEAVFDDDPLTFFSADEPDYAWVGMDAGKPIKIKEIHYIGRNDDNGIRIGDEYELFYFSGPGWKSLGKRIGESARLNYKNAPINALFWLRNLTRGDEERIFTYEEGEQIWW